MILISLLLTLMKKKSLKRKHRYWVSNILNLRDTYGAFYHLIQELLLGGEQFKSYFRLTTIQFEEVIGRIGSYLQRQNHTRECISPRERLCLTLRYGILLKYYFCINLFKVQTIDNN